MSTPRQRLPPTVRVGQILDAALQEFSAAGYAGARMDDIAARAGLSKGGLYAHFASKEEVFEALLARYLSPPRLDARALVEGSATPRHLAERIVNHLHASLANPAMITAMRLLLAESGRVPHLARRWRQDTADAHQADIARLLELARERGLCGDGAALRHQMCIRDRAAMPRPTWYWLATCGWPVRFRSPGVRPRAPSACTPSVGNWSARWMP